MKVHDFVYQEQLPSSHLARANDAETEVMQDDMYNYQRNLMDHGMLYLNFTDAIREGDGERIIRCWKYLLLHFFADGDKNTKYAIEALFLQFQQQAYMLQSLILGLLVLSQKSLSPNLVLKILNNIAHCFIVWQYIIVLVVSLPFCFNSSIRNRK